MTTNDALKKYTQFMEENTFAMKVVKMKFWVILVFGLYKTFGAMSKEISPKQILELKNGIKSVFASNEGYLTASVRLGKHHFSRSR